MRLAHHLHDAAYRWLFLLSTAEIAAVICIIWWGAVPSTTTPVPSGDPRWHARIIAPREDVATFWMKWEYMHLWLSLPAMAGCQIAALAGACGLHRNSIVWVCCSDSRAPAPTLTDVGSIAHHDSPHLNNEI